MSSLPAASKASTLDDFGLVQQHAVGNDLGFEAGGAELFGHVFGGLVVFRRGGHVRLGGERLQVFAGELGVGHGEELLLDVGLFAEVGVAEDLRRRCGAAAGVELGLPVVFGKRKPWPDRGAT